MLQITIQCEPHELQSHLDALRAKTSTAPLFDKDAKDAAAAFAIAKQKLTAEDESQEAEAIEAGKKLDAYHAAEIAAEQTMPLNLGQKMPIYDGGKPLNEAARRGRKPKAETAPEPEPKPQIATGEERVNPQDLADEKAESDAKKPTSGLTVDDVRRKVKAYGDHFGHEAAMTDTRLLIGCSISELKTDYDSLHKAIVAISDAIFHNKRPGQPEATKPEPVAEAKPEPESLFGGVAKEPEAVATPVATAEEVNAAARVYCDTYDGKGKPFKDCANFLLDVSAMVTKLFGDKVKTLRDIDGMPGDRAEHYGRLRAEILQAVTTNPYGRTRV